jgi:hypothetical protein
MFLATPNLGSPSRRLKGKRWYGFGDETHISMKHSREWLDLLRAAGFRVRKAFGDGLWDVPYVPLVPNLLQLAVVGLPAVVQTVMCRPLLPAAISESLLVIAEKSVGSASLQGQVGL